MPRDTVQPFAMSGPLRETLLVLRSRTHDKPTPTITEAELAAVESDLEGRLPSDLLATMTALGWPLSAVITKSEHAWSCGLSRDYAVFARGPEGAWCVALGKTRSETAKVGVWTADEDAPFLDSSVNRYLRRRFDLFDVDAEQVSAAADHSFVPGLIPTPAPQSWPTDVRHSKFGDGVVVEEIRDGNHKLVVDFATGRRTLLARFCPPREVAA